MKERLKELKQREFARNVSSKSWKDEKKQEKALKRLHQIAQLKQQSDKEKKTKLTVLPQDQTQEKLRLDENEPTPKNILCQDQNPSSPSPNVTTKIHPPFPVRKNQCSLRVKCSSLLAQTPRGHRHAKAGISFCFSKRAHLKLDSCASVFTDALDETSDHKDVQRQQQKLALQALLSRSPSPTQDDNHVHLDPMPLNTSAQKETDPTTQEGSLEMQVMYCTIEAKRESCPEKCGPEFDIQPASSTDRAGNDERSYECLMERSSLLKNPGPTVNTDGHKNMTPGQLNAHYSKHNLQRSSEMDTLMTENCLLEGDLKSKTFLNVVGKDGTKLKWPCELVQYTSDEPRVSYSCNPLFLNFKSTEGKERQVDTGKTNVCNVSDQPNRAEEQTTNTTQADLGILKPKKHKHRRRRIHTCKIDAVRRHKVACALSSFSQSPSEGQLEFKSTPASKLRIKQNCTQKRQKLRNRKNSEDETQQLHLKSIIVNAFSAPQRRRRKRHRLPPALRLARRKAFLHASIQSSAGSGDNYQWCRNFCKSKQDDSVTPLKSNSWRVLSELRSDGEYPACQWQRRCTSSSASSYTRRSEYSQPCSYIRKSNYNIPSYNYSQMSNSPDKDTGPKEEFYNYRDSEIYKKKNYYGICDRRCIVKQKYAIRKHKRHLRYPDCHNRATKRICFYRVYKDGNDQHDTERHWWYKRPNPDLRRCKGRSRYWLRSVVSHEQGDEQSGPMLRHSPAASSITSISDISGESGSYIKQSSSGQNDIKCPALKSAITKHFYSRDSAPREKSLSPKSASIDRPEAVKSELQAVISDFGGKLKSSAQNLKSFPLTEQSPSSDKKVSNSRICALSLPLIGKLPSIKKGLKQAGMHKEKVSSSSWGNQVKTFSNGQSKPECQAVFKTAPIAMQNSTSPQVSPSLTDQRNAEPFGSSEMQKDRSISHENLISILGKTSDKSSANLLQTSSIFPLTEKPITFTEEEIDKYRLLQLQAQQHVQQKHLQEQHDMPRSSIVAQMNQLPVPGPEPLNQTSQAPCLSYTINQHGALSTFSSFISCPSACLASCSSPTTQTPLCPTFPHPHFTPFPIPAVFYQASPAVMLATHPLHFISTGPFHHSHLHSHIAGLTFHPQPHASLLPSVITPAAMVAGRNLQIHPTARVPSSGSSAAPWNC